ncbi:hypothetical protein ACWDWV_39050, partial [Streptosporangium sandarakinum]
MSSDQPPAAAPPAPDGPAPEPETPAQCGRPGCGNLLPPRPRHPDGRPKGGRRQEFCSATCRSAARPARQAAQRAALDQATRGARGLHERLEPLIAQLLPLLSGMADHLAAATRVQDERLHDAEDDADAALQAATAAEHRAAASVREINPLIDVVVHNVALSTDNV